MPRRTKKIPRYFEDLKVGEVWEAPSRTHNESLFYAFQLVSGDNRPLHYDMEYCKSLGLPGLLAHGYQVLAQTAPGASDMSRGDTEIRILGMLEIATVIYILLQPHLCRRWHNHVKTTMTHLAEPACMRTMLRGEIAPNCTITR